MDANGTSHVKAQRHTRGLAAVLKSAATEWVLLGLLLFNAVLSCFLTRFARHHGMKIPCILCSRLDHILGNEKPGFYRNLLCGKHRSEVSSLVACHIHGKITDGRGMCEECLFSFVLKVEPNLGMYRALLGKVGVHSHASKSSLLNSNFAPATVGTRICSCCKEPWISRQKTHKLLHQKGTKPDIPLPCHSTHREHLKKMRERFSGSATSRRLGKFGYDPLSYIGYSELKISSDSESEFPFSDDDEVSSAVHGINDHKEESNVQSALKVHPQTVSRAFSPEKVSHHSSRPRTQPGVGTPLLAKCLGPESDNVCKRNSESNRHQADQKHNPIALPELISLDDLPPSNVSKSSAGALENESEVKFPMTKNPYSPASSELMSLVDAPSLFNVSRVPHEATENKNDGGMLHFRNTPVNKYEEILESMNIKTRPGFIGDRVINEDGSVNSTHLSLKDVWKPNVHSKGREKYNFAVGKPTTKEHEGSNEHLKLFPAEGIQAYTAGDTGIMRSHNDKLQVIDASHSDGNQMLQDRVLVERTESSGLESLDEGFNSEIEDENIIDRLKRQIESDKKRIKALYMELEEERNASAIAANQAMAMITRLQEEKASLHMEALQYLRMMEEQAEYDVEALEKANDLLAEREKDIQDMEAELEFFRLKFSDELAAESIPNGNSLLPEKMTIESNGMSHGKDNATFCPPPMFREVSNGSDRFTNSPWSGFEDEKLFISQSLKTLEMKLRQFTSRPSSPYLSDNDQSEETTNRGHDKEGSLGVGQGKITINGDEKENNLHMEMEKSSCNGSDPTKDDSDLSIPKDHIVCIESNRSVSNGQAFAKQFEGIDLETLENEVSDLNERLEALESDWHLVDHSINILQTGKEGLHFVHEIAQQLQELRQIRLRRRCQSEH